MIIKLEITEDVLKMIPALHIYENGDNYVELDKEWLFGGTYELEDISYIIGKEPIKETINDPEGKAFNEKDTAYMQSLAKFMRENLFYIETLIHQFATKGGITVGTYKAKDNELIWEKSND